MATEHDIENEIVYDNTRRTLAIPKRRPRSDDHDALTLVMGTLVDLNIAAQAINQYTDAIAQLAAGLSPDGILNSGTYKLDTNGLLQIDGHVRAHSIAVANLGTCVITCTSGGQISNPGSGPGPGPGTLKIRPGQVVCCPLIGAAHTFYGRPGELVHVTRYKTLQPFMASDIGGAYNPFALGVLTFGGTAVATYTTPWGDNAYYGGPSVKDGQGPAGTADVTELNVTDGNGVQLDLINLSGGETTEDTFPKPVAATSPIIKVTVTKGIVSGTIKVW